MSGAVVTDPAAPNASEHTFGDTTLDEQEIALIRLLAEGLVLDAVARRLGISERTLRRRIRALCDRIGVDAPVQVIVWAAHVGVL